MGEKYVILATAPGAEIPNEVVQRLGWSQVTECTQGQIFDATDGEGFVGAGHGYGNLAVPNAQRPQMVEGRETSYEWGDGARHPVTVVLP